VTKNAFLEINHSIKAKEYVDFKYFSDSWTPFIGVGLGYGKTAISKNVFDKKALLTGEGIVYSPSIGVSYQVNPKISLDLKYSFTILPQSKSATQGLNLTPAELLAMLPVVGSTMTTLLKDMKFHTERSSYLHAITTGIRFSF
jgi:opacity protein-like surface antigen